MTARKDLRPLLAVAWGEPRILTAGDVDLVAWANARVEVVDPDTDPDSVPGAVAVLEHFVNHVGRQGRVDGDRTKSMQSNLRRYLVPALHELADPLHPQGLTAIPMRSIEKRLTHAFAGQELLPAATVAGDRLRRLAVLCVWLTLEDAGAVSEGGLPAVRAALADGRLRGHKDVTGRLLVRPIDLRDAGLLIERTTPWGLAQGTAHNMLVVVQATYERMETLGAQGPRNFKALSAVEPTGDERGRAKRKNPGYLPVEVGRPLGAHLHAVHQLVFWLVRLTGMRISESYGLLVADFRPTSDGTAHQLTITKQGGGRKLVRNPATGQFEVATSKAGTKTAGGARTIRVPAQLAQLITDVIAIHHTDPDGTVRGMERLIPGLARDDASGYAGFQAALKNAIDASGVPSFSGPHWSRHWVITELANADVPERIRHYYAGHSDGRTRTVHERVYDGGVPVELQKPVTDALEKLLAEGGFGGSLITPTTKLENWWAGTAGQARAAAITAEYAVRGWLHPDARTLDDALTTQQAADYLGIGVSSLKRLVAAGEVKGRMVGWGKRHTWAFTRADLDAYRNGPRGMTLTDLAAQSGLSYHQTRSLALRLGVLDGHADRTHIELDGAAVRVVLDEVDRRRRDADAVMDLVAAAERLALPLGQVEKLYRAGTLEPAPSPTGTTRRHVTVASVEMFEEGRQVAVAASPHVVPLEPARKALRISRQRLSALVSSGQVAATTVARKQHVDLASVSAWARKHNRADAVTVLEAHAVPAPVEA